MTTPPADSVEQSVRWGARSADRRPANPRRNAAGFAEGDRFRYLKTDQFVAGSHGVTDYVWVVDRIEPDGSLWVNGGRQRMDAAGQRVAGNDEHTGMWVDYAPPLPLFEMARRGEGAEQDVSTTVSVRDVEGRVERIALKGTMRAHADTLRGPRGMTDLLRAIRVDVDLSGNSQRSDGVQRIVQWQHSYWISLPLLLPVAFSILEAADGLPRQNTRHELIAIDQLSLTEASLSGAAPR